MNEGVVLCRGPVWRANIVEEARFIIPVWLGYVLVVALFAAVLTAFGVEPGSVWEQATQAPRVFALIWGAWQTALYLPLFIAHGRTRREFALDRTLLIPAYGTLFAILMAAGFVIEHFAYAALGWTHELTWNAVLFDAPVQVPWIVLHYFLIIAVWISAGGLVGAAFYRSGWLGLLSIPVALTSIGSVESLLHSGRGLPGWVTIADLSMPLRGLETGALVSVMMGAAVYLSLLVAALGLTWVIIRDVPVRASNV